MKGNWNYPTRVWAGPGRIAELPKACEELGIVRPLIVTDSGLKDSPMIRQALSLVPTAKLFADVRGNPVAANVEAGLKAYHAGAHDGVIAFGGGSGLDAGKVIAFMSGQTRPLWDFEDIGDWWTRADPKGIAPIVAVPTTAGTGSEVGRAGVILNEETHQKKIIFHPKMMPGIVIADPELTVGLPAKITAATGFDAFVHCFEAFCAPGFHPLADGVALEGMRLIKTYLPRACKHGGDMEARSRMLAAASMGATAFQKGLGAVHAIAHPVGSFFDTHHGLTNAVITPYVIVHNREAIAERMKVVSRVCWSCPSPASTACSTGCSTSARNSAFRIRWPISASRCAIRRRSAARRPSIHRRAEIPFRWMRDTLSRIFRSAVKGDLSLKS